jgi:hypothetical protein
MGDLLPPVLLFFSLDCILRLSPMKGTTHSSFLVLYSKKGVDTSTSIFIGCFIPHNTKPCPPPPCSSSCLRAEPHAGEKELTRGRRSLWRRRRRSLDSQSSSWRRGRRSSEVTSVWVVAGSTPFLHRYRRRTKNGSSVWSIHWRMNRWAIVYI